MNELDTAGGRDIALATLFLGFLGVVAYYCLRSEAEDERRAHARTLEKLSEARSVIEIWAQQSRLLDEKPSPPTLTLLPVKRGARKKGTR